MISRAADIIAKLKILCQMLTKKNTLSTGTLVLYYLSVQSIISDLIYSIADSLG